MLTATRWGFEPLRSTPTLIYPAGFTILYEQQRWMPEHLTELALQQTTPQSRAQLYIYLETLTRELATRARELLPAWGIRPNDTYDTEDLNDDGRDFNKALDAAYNAMSRLRAIETIEQNIKLIRAAPITEPLNITGEIDTTYRPLHPELREFTRYLHIRHEQRQLLILNNDTLNDIITYTKGAVYNITNVPMYLARDYDMLNTHLRTQQYQIRRRAYDLQCKHYPTID